MTDAPCCYICHEEGVDEMGEPVIHGGCSCRDIGHSHASCLVKFAKTRARQGQSWSHCVNCSHPWSGVMADILARESEEMRRNEATRQAETDAIRLVHDRTADRIAQLFEYNARVSEAEQSIAEAQQRVDEIEAQIAELDEVSFAELDEVSFAEVRRSVAEAEQRVAEMVDQIAAIYLDEVSE